MVQLRRTRQKLLDSNEALISSHEKDVEDQRAQASARIEGYQKQFNEKSDQVADLAHKLNQANIRVSSLESDKAVLEREVRDAQVETEALQNRIHNILHTPEIDEEKRRILMALGVEGPLTIDHIASLVQLPATHVHHHLDNLVRAEYVDQPFFSAGGGNRYSLTELGRKYFFEQTQTPRPPTRTK